MKKKGKAKLNKILNIYFNLKYAEIGEWNISFWYYLNTTECEFKNFNIGTGNAIQKKLVCTSLAAQIGQANGKFTFINAIAVSLLLIHLSFACNPAFYFNVGKKLRRGILFSSVCFCYYILLPSSACFWQHFHDWFSVLKYNSDLAKLEWTPLLFNFN